MTLRTIRKTEKELEKEGYELLQSNFWGRSSGRASYFDCVMRCSSCFSLLDLGTIPLEAGQVISIDACENCGEYIRSFMITGRESVIIKRKI